MSYLSQLFAESDLVWATKDLKGQNCTLQSATSLPAAAYQFYCINPVAEARKSSNVTAYRNFVLESDSLPLEVQKNIISHLNTNFMPIKLAVFSGSKSIHLIFSVSDTLISAKPGSEQATIEYKKFWKALYKGATESATKFLQITESATSLAGHIFDPATSDPVRLSRTPEATRDNGIVQSVLHEGNYFLADNLHHITPQYVSNTEKPKTTYNSNLSLFEFESALESSTNQWLAFKLVTSPNWLKPSNNYPEIFKLVLWAIDATGVPLQTFTQYYDKVFVPALKSLGYKSDMYAPVINAYKYKNLL